MKNNLFKGLSIIILIGLLLTACGGGGTQAVEEPTAEATQVSVAATEAPVASGGVLTVGIPVEPETLDPGDGVYAVSYTHLRAHETVLESRMPSSA